jgi:hypothetical protein
MIGFSGRKRPWDGDGSLNEDAAISDARRLYHPEEFRGSECIRTAAPARRRSLLPDGGGPPTLQRRADAASVTKATIRSAWPQRGQTKGSTSWIRASSMAQHSHRRRKRRSCRLSGNHSLTRSAIDQANPVAIRVCSFSEPRGPSVINLNRRTARADEKAG